MKKEEKRILTLDNEEYGVVVNALYDKHNNLLKENQLTELVDDVLRKTINAPNKKVKCRCDETR